MRARLITLAALLALVAGVPLAQAAPDLSVGTILDEDDGLLAVCDAPCFSIDKQVEVYNPGNPTAPGVCLPGDYTYVYTLTHIGGSATKNGGQAGGLIPPLTQFELQAPFNVVSTAGFIPGPGVSPDTVIVSPLNVVTWDFPVSAVFPGQSSNPLFLCSTAPPGLPTDNMASATGVFLDAPGTCVGPVLVSASCELEIDKTCCVPPPPASGVDQCEGKVLGLKFRYTGDDCSATTNSQEGKAKCSGDPQSSAPIDVVVTKDADKIAVDGMLGGNGTYVLGDTFTVTNDGDSDGRLKASTKLRVDAPMGDQDLTIHTSCSKALSCGDQFGSLELVELVTTEGGTINCEAPPGQGTACVQQNAAAFACEDKIASIQFEWTGEACQNPLGNSQGGKAECTGSIAGAEPVNVTYVGGDPDKITVSPASGIDVGELFSLTATGRDDLKSSTKFVVTDAGGVVQNVELHTSCSKPIDCGDEFGGFKVVSILGTDGSVCDLAPPGPLFADACEVALAPPAPHCTSKVMELQLAYVGDAFGEGCTVSNPQSGNASCSGVADPGDPVSITITEDPSKVSASPSSGIGFTDVFSITKFDGEPKELSSSTEFDVSGPGGTQSLEIHTSCSKPLNLGDRFGSLVVVGIDRKDDGFVGLGGEVEYQYTVTNPNASPAVVDVNDNPFGPIVDDALIPPGGTETFFVTKTLLATLTNEATVSGTVNGDVCSMAQDEVTVTVTAPPQGFFECSDAKPIDGLSMVWDGMQNVCVRAYDGSAGGTLLQTFANVAPGDVVTVNGMGGSPNDQQWQIFNVGCGGAPLGISQFHISCSDSNMNGVEDCGTRQGNGKSDSAGLINDWLLEGIDGDVDLDCTPDPIVLPGPSFCGIGFELALLLPPLMWLRRRRARSS